MLLSSIELDVLIDEIRKNDNNEFLIQHILGLKDSNLINILISKPNIINSLPKSIITFYENVIIDNYRIIISKCSIGDKQLLKKIIDRCIADDYAHQGSRDIALHSNLDAEYLYYTYKDFFTPKVILNFMTSPLRESFIFKINDFPRFVDRGFYYPHRITKSLLKRVDRNRNEESKDSFYNSLLKVIQTKVVMIDDSALSLCLKPMIIDDLMKTHSINGSTQSKLFKLVKKDESKLITFLETQNVSDFTLKYRIKECYLQYYLAKNKYYNDSVIIDYHKNKPNINWLYINTTINMSEHMDYVNYLLSKGEHKIVEYNILLNYEKGVPLKNIRKLINLGLNKEILYNYLSNNLSGLEIGIHKKSEITN